ncbi:MAG TPA: hypothetical protein VFC63_00520 [Blastocatellia bacterium]|nr:hypothetical protein [Blastocatellia bacterium]
MSYNNEETGGGMVKAIVAIQLLSALYQVVAAVEGGEFDSSASSDSYILFGVVGAVGALSAIWLYWGSNASRVVALVWHLIVAGWMLTNIKTEIITEHPVLLGLVSISVVSVLYLTATSFTGIMRALREQ